MQNAMNGEAEHSEEHFPKIPITATVTPDGRRIQFILPQEFIQANVTVAGDNNGRHRIVLDPTYGGQEVIGFVGPDGVKHGKFEFNPASIGLSNLIPHKSNTWWSKQRERDILMSRLLAGLCSAPPVKVESAIRAHVATPPQPFHPPQPAPAMPPPPVTRFADIEAAVDFVNAWVQDNGGLLVVDKDNSVSIEIQQRIGGKKKKNG